MSVRWIATIGLAMALVACADRPVLDAQHPSIVGQPRSVSARELSRIVQLARQHLEQTGRASHAIYRLEFPYPYRVLVFHAEPPKHEGDCLESFDYDRVHGTWQLSGPEIVCGANIPTG